MRGESELSSMCRTVVESFRQLVQNGLDKVIKINEDEGDEEGDKAKQRKEKLRHGW